MSDPHEIQDETTVSCDVCETDTVIPEFVHLTNGDWHYGDWVCKCGEEHGGMSGNALDLVNDAGYTTAAASLFWLGVLMVVAPLAHLFVAPPTLAHLYLILVGAFLVAGIATLGTIAALGRNHS